MHVCTSARCVPQSLLIPRQSLCGCSGWWGSRKVRRTTGRRLHSFLPSSNCKILQPYNCRIRSNPYQDSGCRWLRHQFRDYLLKLASEENWTGKKGKMEQRTEKRRTTKLLLENKKPNRSCVIEKPKSKLDEIRKLGNQKSINSTFSRMNYP